MTARLTFLRRHVAQQAALGADSPEWEGLEVFRTFPRHAPARSLRDFFHGTNTLPPLYRPVGLEPNPGDARPGETDHAPELPALLARLHSRRAAHGVLLSAPGGAGKSVALRKAFLDCLDPSTALGATRLVPCWLRLSSDHNDVALPDVFREAVRPLALTDERPVWDWLDSGPPVLLLCDLDDPGHVPPHRRAALADFLGRLQGNQRWQRRQHRVVVAHRSSGDLCLVARSLLAPGHFRRHCLLELDADAVAGYLGDLRLWAAELTGSAPPQADSRAWRPFIDGMERRPLLMHLLGAYFAETPDPTPTSARLVARMVERQLGHALTSLPPNLLARLPDQELNNVRRWALAGLSRAARRAWAARQPGEPQPRQHLQDAMLAPRDHLPLPQGEYWYDGFSPYWGNEPGLALHAMAFVDLVYRSPWVSCSDAGHYRVGPTVFVNFFAAVMPALHRQGPAAAFDHPEMKDDAPWFAEVVALCRQHLDAWAGERFQDHDAWQQAAALLAGLLRPGEFFALIRAWLRDNDPHLLRLGLALLHGWHPADPPSPPQCPGGLLRSLRDALAEAVHTGFDSDPMTIYHELRPGQPLENFARVGSAGEKP